MRLSLLREHPPGAKLGLGAWGFGAWISLLGRTVRPGI